MHVLPGLLMVKMMLPLFENISMWGGKFYRKVGRNGFTFLSHWRIIFGLLSLLLFSLGH